MSKKTRRGLTPRAPSWGSDQIKDNSLSLRGGGSAEERKEAVYNLAGEGLRSAAAEDRAGVACPSRTLTLLIPLGACHSAGRTALSGMPCFANNRKQSAVLRWSFSYSGEEHVPAPCQLTLGCSGTTNEILGRQKDRITSPTKHHNHLHSRPTPAAFGCYISDQIRFPPWRPRPNFLVRAHSPYALEWISQPYSCFLSQHNPNPD